MSTAQLVLEDGTAVSGRLFGSAEIRGRRGRVQHRHGRLHRGADRPVVPRPDPGADLSAGRQLRRAAERFEIAAHPGHRARWCRELATSTAMPRARSLPQWLKDEGIPCLAGVDTRALTKRLRSRGCMLGKIVVGERGRGVRGPQPGQPRRRRQRPEPRRLRRRTARPSCWSTAAPRTTSSRSLRERGLHGDPRALGLRLPARGLRRARASPTAPAIRQTCGATIEHVRRALELGRPILGICLGNQLLALAAGASTYKLKFGHRGQNQPCVEVGTGRCFITSQNHGFAVDEPRCRRAGSRGSSTPTTARTRACATARGPS